MDLEYMENLNSFFELNKYLKSDRFNISTLLKTSWLCNKLIPDIFSVDSTAKDLVYKIEESKDLSEHLKNHLILICKHYKDSSSNKIVLQYCTRDNNFVINILGKTYELVGENFSNLLEDIGKYETENNEFSGIYVQYELLENFLDV